MPARAENPPAFSEIVRVFAVVGALSFGGPAGQIALMHRELVERRGWLTEAAFLNALSFCMLLPGPEATQLATYAGWRLHGVAGGLVAGLLFVLPGAAVIATLAALYASFGADPLVAALFFGVKAAVVVIVIEALLKVSRRALNGPAAWAVAGLAFIAIFFLALPFPLIVAAAGIWGFALGRRGAVEAAPEEPVDLGRVGRTAVVWVVIWLAPLGALTVLTRGGLLWDIFVFFSWLALVTFGGAYAVLAWMAQVVVADFGWLTTGEMIDALGLAETTPGPLILVTEFVAFLAAAKAGGLWFGALGALVALWATFAPCFLWIFTGAPFLEWLGAAPRLRAALAGVSAAVVGVILNLSIWFALHVFFGEVTRERLGWITLWSPDIASIDWRALAIALLAAGLLLWRGWSLVAVLVASAALGLGLTSP
ncbi:chromate efflux transporter [Pikeienuella piscinae]|uniref:Chromate efflux transporter n=1 Tax=Pikeienuella piscinae TaxID=2748098 RepID=A0A7L5BYG7_9RHOB|nr:chromate efflux transporter [Pikeienuella piscinae]QIE56965.1 chromate efflux transporter [Pikeienuella piscinae]